MRLSRLLFIAAVFPAMCYGRLGDFESELISRFGPPVARAHEITLAQGKILEFGSTLSFRQGVWSVASVIIDGRCAREAYTKPGDWTQDQFKTILSANSQGASWTDISKEMVKGLVREWHRDDGADAVWHLGGAMVVTNPAYYRAKQAIEQRAKADAAQVPKI